MSDDAQRWKDKYLSSLEQQEKLERRWELRLDLLRRGLVRSSLAAEGADKAVDQCMQEMREILRRDDMDAALGGLIPRLEKAVVDSEQRRQQRAGEAAMALAGLIEQLQRLQPPREVRKALKSLGKQLQDATSHQYLLPALLSQLSNLQRQALTVLQSPVQEQPGLLQRLFGTRTESSDDEQSNAQVADDVAEPASTPETSAPAALAPISQSPASAAVLTREPAPRPLPDAPPVLDSLPLPPGLLPQQEPGDSPFSLPSSEPGYSAVAPHIAGSLRKLLDELELPARHQPQGEALRLRLQGNLNWYELVPVLDDLAVLVLAVSDSGQREFAGYLKQLNERLAVFIGTLNAASEGYSASLESTRSFNQQLRDQVSDLQSSVQEASDLESLKQALEQRLEGLLQSVKIGRASCRERV